MKWPWTIKSRDLDTWLWRTIGMTERNPWRNNQPSAAVQQFHVHVHKTFYNQGLSTIQLGKINITLYRGLGTMACRSHICDISYHSFPRLYSVALVELGGSPQAQSIHFQSLSSLRDTLSLKQEMMPRWYDDLVDHFGVGLDPEARCDKQFTLDQNV